MTDSEFGSDGLLRSDPANPPAPQAERKPFTSGDPFAQSEPGAAGQRVGLLSEPNEAEFSTTERLRLFEDEHLGKDHLRHNHQVEKGIGSPFSMLTDKQRAHHAALEHLIAVEKEHAEAETRMDGVHAKLEAAVARAADTEGAL